MAELSGARQILARNLALTVFSAAPRLRVTLWGVVGCRYSDCLTRRREGAEGRCRSATVCRMNLETSPDLGLFVPR